MSVEFDAERLANLASREPSKLRLYTLCLHLRDSESDDDGTRV